MTNTQELSRLDDEQRQAQTNPLSRADWVAMFSGLALCLIISLLFGYRIIFWEDEMLGWMLLHDPSWAHMISAWKQGADGGGFTFYATCRGWFGLFGASEVSFRMYSAVCFGLAFCVTWITARKFYLICFVAPALFGAWFLSPPLVTHLAEGRFYGLLVLMVSLVVWFTVVFSRRLDATTGVLCGWAFVLNGILVTSHVLGIVYSATLLAGLMLVDRREARWRPAVYAATGASWLLLLPERAAIVATTRVGKPYFWTTPPNLSRFFGAYCEFSAGVAGLLFLLFLLIVISRRGGRPAEWRTALRVATEGRRAVLLPVFVLFLLPVALTLQAQVGTSLFINRYLMPLTVSEALLLCQLFALVEWQRLLRRIPASWARGIFLGGGILECLLILGYVFGYLLHIPRDPVDFTAKLTARLPHGVPVLCEDAWIFTQLIGRQHGSGVNYTYLLDWPQTISKSAPRLEVTQYNLMNNWRKVGYFSGSVQEREPFLAEHARFLVLHAPFVPPPEGPMIGNPLVARFKQTPGYEVLPYDATPKGGIEIWQVCRQSCGR